MEAGLGRVVSLGNANEEVKPTERKRETARGNSTLRKAILSICRSAYRSDNSSNITLWSDPGPISTLDLLRKSVEQGSKASLARCLER